MVLLSGWLCARYAHTEKEDNFQPDLVSLTVHIPNVPSNFRALLRDVSVFITVSKLKMSSMQGLFQRRNCKPATNPFTILNKLSAHNKSYEIPHEQQEHAPTSHNVKNLNDRGIFKCIPLSYLVFTTI